MPEKTLPQITQARLRSLDRAREIEWISQHRQQYLGQWVVLDGDQLIASGTDPRSLFEQARAQGIERPFIVRIHEEPSAYTGGWL